MIIEIITGTTMMVIIMVMITLTIRVTMEEDDKAH